MNKFRAFFSVFLLSCVLIFCSCTNEQVTTDVLTGTWKTVGADIKDTVGTYSIIQFVEGQKGVTGVQTPYAYVWGRQFDYRIEGDKVIMSVNYDSEIKTTIYTFKVDGKTLTLMDSYDETIKTTYIRE